MGSYCNYKLECKFKLIYYLLIGEKRGVENKFNIWIGSF